MRKNIIILFFYLSLSLFVEAKEPVLATLVNIISNEKQEFKIGNYRFTCTPYGVYTLEELFKNSDDDSVCKKSIQNFYKKRLDLVYYAESKLHIRQLYSLVFKEGKCLINISGEKTYTELLLEEGLAIKIPSQLKKEYDFTFYKAQRKSKLDEVGLWRSNIAKECKASINIKSKP